MELARLHHHLGRTLLGQEARDLPTHTYLSLLVPSIQFLKLPLDFIDQANHLVMAFLPLSSAFDEALRVIQ